MSSTQSLPDYHQSDSEILTTLTSHGGFAFEPSHAEYVIHTHTVPLASTVDTHYLLEGGKSQFHGFEAGNKGIECPKRSCMYIHKNGSRGHESIPKNCPCLEVQSHRGEALKPRCFLTYTRSLGRLLASESEEVEYMDPKSIMFCQTHVSVFDNKYPGYLRDAIHVTGWRHVNEEKLLSIMRSLYWYRSYMKVLGLDKLIGTALEKLGFRQVRHAITQAIHTINGVIIKKFMAFCSETVRYGDFAKQTAYLFRDLFSDYTHPLHYVDGKLALPKRSVYLELKEFLNQVKASFHQNTYENRCAWLKFPFESKSLRRIFNEVQKLQSFCEVKFQNGLDYTESPAWIFRCTTLCQTRVLGYLPIAIAEVHRKRFRENISRELEKPPKAQIRYIDHAVTQELRWNNIPRNFMERPLWRDASVSRRFTEAMSAIELPLKGSASVDHYVREGGKIEDARHLINLAMVNQWEIPIRDLHDHEVLETFVIPRDDPNESRSYVRPLFWLSYTIVLNHFVKKGSYPGQLYYPLRIKDRLYEPDPMRASIVHISEPGKERNLTKSTGVLTWFLTPMSKISQDTLAELPEHTAGLTASSHEWRHQKRISSLSDEASFIYDISTGYTKPRIIHSFKDWTESTDFIGKFVGWAHLRALLNYIAFPEGYMNLIGMSIMEPQPVSEVVALRNFEEESLESVPVQWTGYINEGYMMGNPVTKSILHLIHVSERYTVRKLLDGMSVTEEKPGPYRGLGDPVRLDRKSTTKGFGSTKTEDS